MSDHLFAANNNNRRFNRVIGTVDLSRLLRPVLLDVCFYRYIGGWDRVTAASYCRYGELAVVKLA